MSQVTRFLAAALAAFTTVAVAGADKAVAQRRPAPSCAAEIGPAEARRLVQECRESQPATPAMCRLDTRCEAMREMIAEACREPGGEDRPICRDLEDEDEDDDE